MYAKARKAADAIDGIVFKTCKNKFEVCKGMQDLAIAVVMQPSDACYYECISNVQATYLDLDLKVKDCVCVPPKVEADKQEMPKQCLKLLEWGYQTYLEKPFNLDMVTIGESCGKEKVSFHIHVYDGMNAWKIGLTNGEEYYRCQKYFITLLRKETLENPEIQDCLTFKRNNNVIDSVIDNAPYNSKGNQPLRTLLSSKVGSNRFMTPYDG